MMHPLPLFVYDSLRQLLLVVVALAHVFAFSWQEPTELPRNSGGPVVETLSPEVLQQHLSHRQPAGSLSRSNPRMSISKSHRRIQTSSLLDNMRSILAGSPHSEVSSEQKQSEEKPVIHSHFKDPERTPENQTRSVERRTSFVPTEVNDGAVSPVPTHNDKGVVSEQTETAPDVPFGSK
jgi:hypothetical protein